MPRWSLVLFVVVFAASSRSCWPIAARESRRLRGRPPRRARARAWPITCARCSGSPPSTGRHPGGRLARRRRNRRQIYGGGAVERALRRRLPRAGEVELDGNSDHASFARAGIPAGGIFTGLDDCYHLRCDRLGNVDRDLLARSAAATEAALLELSRVSR